MFRKLPIVVACALPVTLNISTARAQQSGEELPAIHLDTAPAPLDDTDSLLVDDYALETIVVTADKHHESAQTVPFSVQAFKGHELAEAGITDIKQLTTAVPNLQFTTVAGFPLVFMRGLGTDNFVPSADPSVATYVDGIYMPSGIAGITSLAGIENVEVVKGPQGTLFGRGAVAGAINMTTLEPGAEYHGDLLTQTGSYDDLTTRASISGPITDWFSAGVSGVYSKQDSPYTNRYYAPSDDKQQAARLKLSFHYGEWSLGLTGYTGKQSGTFNLIAQNVAPSMLGRASGIQPQADDYSAENDHPAYTKSKQRLGYGVFSWAGPRFDVKVLGSLQRLDTPYSSIDFDASPNPVAALTTTNTYTHLQTVELQILSNDQSWLADRIQWVAGAYYLRSRAGADPGALQLSPGTVTGFLNILQSPAVSEIAQGVQDLVDAIGLVNTPLGSGGLGIVFRGELATRSISGYTQAAFKVTDRVELTVGGRLQHEYRYLTKSQTDIASLIGDSAFPVDYTELPGATSDTFAPKVVLSYKPWVSTLFYASYATAYKSGTFNIANIFNEPTYIKPEKVTSLEVGLKYQSPNDRFRFNAAAFRSNIDNLQSGFVSIFSAGAVTFVTVPHARAQGVEVDSKWVAIPGRNPLTVSVSAAYLDAIYTDYPDGRGFEEGSGSYRDDLDLSGRDTVYSPSWTGYAEVEQAFQVSKGVLEFAIGEYANSGYYTDANNTTREPGFALMNARIGYRFRPWNASIMGFCTNLLDRRYHAVNVQTDFGTVKTLSDPRIVGVRLALAF